MTAGTRRRLAQRGVLQQVGRLVRRIDERFYPGFGDNWDDDLFRAEILRVLRRGARVLDLGAGTGKLRQMDFSGCGATVWGVDPDPSVLQNPHLDEARVAQGEEIPCADGSFDVVFANNVLEHLADPPAVFREVARVLAPGGLFLIKTPNRRHYVAWIARWTPHGFHQWVNGLRGRARADTFPTHYRANSVRQLARCAAAAGLETMRLSHHEGRPEYLRLSALTYVLGLAYERLVNAVTALASFRVLLVGVFRKPEAAGSDRGEASPGVAR